MQEALTSWAIQLSRLCCIRGMLYGGLIANPNGGSKALRVPQ